MNIHLYRSAIINTVYFKAPIINVCHWKHQYLSLKNHQNWGRSTFGETSGILYKYFDLLGCINHPVGSYFGNSLKIIEALVCIIKFINAILLQFEKGRYISAIFAKCFSRLANNTFCGHLIFPDFSPPSSGFTHA